MNTATPALLGSLAVASARAHRAAGERVFDGGDTLLEKDVMRANWTVPWSDLMMTMFILFATVLAACSMRCTGWCAAARTGA